MADLTAHERRMLEWYRALSTDSQRQVNHLITRRDWAAVLLMFRQQIRDRPNAANRVLTANQSD